MSSIPCTHCTSPVEITEMHRGRRIRCPRCGEGFAVPLAPASARPTMQAAAPEILDVTAADEILTGIVRQSVCQSCLRLAPTAPVIFHQHIGAIVMYFHKHIDTRLCRECIDRHFRDYTLTTLFLGWWGMVSFILTPFFLLMNLVRYSSVPSLPASGQPAPQSRGTPVLLGPEDRRAVARQKVLPPAIILTMIASIGLLWGVFGVITLASDLSNPPPAPPAEPAVEAPVPEEKPVLVVGKPAAKQRPVKIETPEEKRSRQTTNIILWGTQGTVSLVILLSAIQMMRLRTRWLGLTGSILAVIPVIGPCFCLALPVGIWAIIVLCRADVRAAFV